MNAQIKECQPCEDWSDPEVLRAEISRLGVALAEKEERIARYDTALELAVEVKTMMEARIVDLEARLIAKAEKIGQMEAIMAYGDARTRDLLKHGERRKANQGHFPERRHPTRVAYQAAKELAQ